MEYRDSSTDNSKITSIYQNATTEENALPANYFDSNSKNCKESSPVDFLYLSTIRGGRKNLMKKGGNCGCNMTGGNDDIDNIGAVDEMGQPIRQQNYGQTDGQTDGQNYDETELQNGGCFTCKKGIKNITHIYSTVHIIIPTLYSKYKKGISMKEKKIKKPKGVKK